MLDMVQAQHGKEDFDKKYYARFFKQNGELDFSTYVNWFTGWYNFVKNRAPLVEGKNKKVLEIGCAIGTFSKILNEKGFEVTATDISEFILKEARGKTPNVEFRVLDIEKEPRVKEKFDYIFAFEVLEHLKDPEKALENIKNLLKPKGVFIFSTPFISEQTLKDPTHINVHDPKYWLELGKRNSFKNLKFIYVSFLPFLYRWSKLFSVGLPVKINNAWANSTTLYFFEK